ncbi:MAG: hypothetical protein J6P61_02485 [Erysipelotrichaceae bacterium]|nr:hypothetical protein [Erysipelotrichaceae bacterium]
MSKVLFLDCDGVLNNETTTIISPVGYIGLDPRNFDVLVDFVNETGVDIVLTSTWQNNPGMYAYLCDELEKVGLSIAGVTHERSIRRGKGVTDYIKKHNVEHWVVFDDYVFPDFEAEGIIPHLILTDFYEGLLPQDIIRAKMILNEEY